MLDLGLLMFGFIVLLVPNREGLFGEQFVSGMTKIFHSTFENLKFCKNFNCSLFCGVDRFSFVCRRLLGLLPFARLFAEGV